MLEGMKAVVPTRHLERGLWNKGYRIVAGVDEVGRGPLAGPVTVAAVVLPDRCRLAKARDSKLLTHAQRAALAREIRSCAVGIGIGWTDSRRIDEYGLTKAMRLAALEALGQLPASAEAVILDGVHNYLGRPCVIETCVKADQSSLAVAAASIIAKVARDQYMELLDSTYPDYGFASHRGYGSRDHLEVLRRIGPCPQHRRSWQPVREATLVNN